MAERTIDAQRVSATVPRCAARRRHAQHQHSRRPCNSPARRQQQLHPQHPVRRWPACARARSAGSGAHRPCGARRRVQPCPGCRRTHPLQLSTLPPLVNAGTRCSCTSSCTTRACSMAPPSGCCATCTCLSPWTSPGAAARRRRAGHAVHTGRAAGRRRPPPVLQQQRTGLGGSGGAWPYSSLGGGRWAAAGLQRFVQAGGENEESNSAVHCAQHRQAARWPPPHGQQPAGGGGARHKMLWCKSSHGFLNEPALPGHTSWGCM